MIEYAHEAAEDVDRHHEWLLAHSARAAEAFMAQVALAEARVLARPTAFRFCNDGEGHLLA